MKSKSMACDTHNDRRFDKTAMQASAMLIRIAKLDQPPAKSSAKPNPISNAKSAPNPANSAKPPQTPPRDRQTTS